MKKGPPLIRLQPLQLTAVNDLGLDVGADSTGAAAKGLNILHDLVRVVISDLAKDDVLSVEPRSGDSGDEELGAVAVRKVSQFYKVPTSNEASEKH